MLAAALGLGAACATSPGAPPPDDADAATLSATFGRCDPDQTVDDENPATWIPERAAQYVTVTDDWRHLETVTSATRTPQGERYTFPAEVVADGTAQEVRVHANLWPGIDWALAHDDDVWLAMGDDGAREPDIVDYVAVFTDDDVWFPGSCKDTRFYQPLHERLGDDTASVLARLPGATPDERDELLGIERFPAHEPTETILQDADDATLEGLDHLSVMITADPLDTAETYTFCTRIDAGWNDCLFADDPDLAGGIDINAFVDGTGVLQFWLLDAFAHVEEPVLDLGRVSVDEARTSAGQVRVTIDTDAVEHALGALTDGDGVPAAVEGAVRPEGSSG